MSPHPDWLLWYIVAIALVMSTVVAFSWQRDKATELEVALDCARADLLLVKEERDAFRRKSEERVGVTLAVQGDVKRYMALAEQRLKRINELSARLDEMALTPGPELCAYWEAQAKTLQAQIDTLVAERDGVFRQVQDLEAKLEEAKGRLGHEMVELEDHRPAVSIVTNRRGLPRAGFVILRGSSRGGEPME